MTLRDLIATGGGRKFVVAEQALWMSFILALTGDLDGTWIAAITAVLTLYGAANIAKAAIDKKASAP